MTEAKERVVPKAIPRVVTKVAPKLALDEPAVPPRKRPTWPAHGMLNPTNGLTGKTSPVGK